jgi:hypothetical protein
MDEQPHPKKEDKVRRWFKKIGIAGFLFFLIKGIVWLIIFYGAATLVSC